MEWLSSGGVLVRCAIGWCGILRGAGWRGGVARAAGAGWRLALRGELGLHAQQHGRLHREISYGRKLRAIFRNAFFAGGNFTDLLCITRVGWLLPISGLLRVSLRNLLSASLM